MPPESKRYRLFGALSLLLLALPAGSAWAKESDRRQDINIESNRQSGDYDDNGSHTWDGNVVLTQGTLKILADHAEMRQRNGDPSLAVFTGKPVKLRQQMDDGTWMDAQANRIEYAMTDETITLIGDYTLSSPKGSSSGQHMVYNTKTGNMRAGGDGSRVKTVIKPKSAQGTATVGKPTPVGAPAAAPSTPTDKP